MCTSVAEFDTHAQVFLYTWFHRCRLAITWVSWTACLSKSWHLFWDHCFPSRILQVPQKSHVGRHGVFQGCAGAKPAALQLSWKQRFGSSARVSVLPGSKLETDKFLIALIALLAPNCHSKYQISFMCCCMLLLQPWHPSWGICSGWNENLVWIMRTVSSRFKGSACDQRL